KGFNDGILQEEGRFQATLLSAAALGGIAVQGSEAVAELRTCCLADDSVAGDQTTLRLRHDAGSWKLSRATKRTLCYRGSDAAGKLCR
ncbi:MAG TPA: hypothetical protein VLC09_21575, partial [Polyangiaceae bacterium]|nr:hypothetical protein [Polyangiaceae bacterium]